MLNYSTQFAFRNLATKIDGYAYGPSTPSIIRTIWDKIKSLWAWMVQFDQPGAGAGQQSMCTIF